MVSADTGSVSRTRRDKSDDGITSTRHTARNFFILAVCLVLVRVFVFPLFVIPSPSMHDTLHEGDRVVVSKIAGMLGSPHRGDVVVFKDSLGWLQSSPSSSANSLTRIGRSVGILPNQVTRYLVKRVIGVGGDHVKCCTPSGKLTVNGVEITEKYIAEGQIPSKSSFDVTVPQGHLWVMGDNRGNSADSLWHFLGGDYPYIADDDVVGPVVFILWPFSRWFQRISDRQTFSNVPDVS